MLESILQTVLNQWGQLPIYIPELISRHAVLVLITAAVYLIVLLASGHFAYTLRWIYVLISIALLLYGYFRGNYSLMWLVIISLVVLALFKMIVALVKFIRRRRKDRKFERKAIARAEKRRGSFETKQAYSGAPRDITPAPYVPEKMNDSEIQNVIRNEVSGNTGNLTEILDSIGAPKDPLAEIAATKAELNEAVITGKFDIEAIEAALKESTDEQSGK